VQSGVACADSLVLNKAVQSSSNAEKAPTVTGQVADNSVPGLLLFGLTNLITAFIEERARCRG